MQIYCKVEEGRGEYRIKPLGARESNGKGGLNGLTPSEKIS